MRQRRQIIKLISTKKHFRVVSPLTDSRMLSCNQLYLGVCRVKATVRGENISLSVSLVRVISQKTISLCLFSLSVTVFLPRALSLSPYLPCPRCLSGDNVVLISVSLDQHPNAITDNYAPLCVCVCVCVCVCLCAVKQ